MSRFFKLPREYRHQHTDTSKWRDCCVPEQALSVRELLDRYSRENKPLPVKVDYDIEAVVSSYSQLEIPQHISRADALHLMDITKRHMHDIEYRMNEASRLDIDASVHANVGGDDAVSAVKPQQE